MGITDYYEIQVFSRTFYTTFQNVQAPNLPSTTFHGLVIWKKIPGLPKISIDFQDRVATPVNGTENYNMKPCLHSDLHHKPHDADSSELSKSQLSNCSQFSTCFLFPKLNAASSSEVSPRFDVPVQQCQLAWRHQISHCCPTLAQPPPAASSVAAVSIAAVLSVHLTEAGSSEMYHVLQTNLLSTSVELR